MYGSSVLKTWTNLVVWKHGFLVDENALDANLSLLANRDARWWPRCLLHLLVASSSTSLTMFPLSCCSDVFNFLVLLLDGPMFILSLRLYLVTEEYVDSFRLADIDR